MSLNGKTDLEKSGAGVSVTASTVSENQTTGFELYEKAQELSFEEEEAIRKKVVWKVDMRIVPLLCITYTLQFLDKLSLNYAAAVV